MGGLSQICSLGGKGPRPWACLVGRERDMAPAISAWGARSSFSCSPALVRRRWSGVDRTPAVVGEEDARGPAAAVVCFPATFILQEHK